MTKNSRAHSLKPFSSTVLLERLFGRGVLKSLGAFKSKTPAERAVAASKARVKTLEIKLNVARRTALAASRVRRKQLASAELESISLAGKVAEVSADRDMLLTANEELRLKAERRAIDPYDQKRMDQSAAETHSLLVGCAEAFWEVDPEGAQQFFRSQGNSATRVLATSITKVYSPKTLPGGKSRAGRASPSSW
jgi:multidrug efflux pump subunit AcrA (membrane-fusion protein)